MIWPPEYPSYDRGPQAPEWKRHMTGADFDDPEWVDPAREFRRDLPVITGDAREQLRRAGDSLRRRRLRSRTVDQASRADRHQARQAKPLRGRLRRAWPTRRRPTPWRVADGIRGDSAQVAACAGSGRGKPLRR